MHQRSDTPSGIVKLNVGGKKHCTSMETISKSRWFSAMFQGNFPQMIDDDGFAFIDRDGDRFSTILNWLRSGSLPIFPAAWRYREICEEADFFCLQELKDYCLEQLHELEAQGEKGAGGDKPCTCPMHPWRPVAMHPMEEHMHTPVASQSQSLSQTPMSSQEELVFDGDF